MVNTIGYVNNGCIYYHSIDLTLCVSSTCTHINTLF